MARVMLTARLRRSRSRSPTPTDGFCARTRTARARQDSRGNTVISLTVISLDDGTLVPLRKHDGAESEAGRKCQPIGCFSNQGKSTGITNLCCSAPALEYDAQPNLVVLVGPNRRWLWLQLHPALRQHASPH